MFKNIIKNFFFVIIKQDSRRYLQITNHISNCLEFWSKFTSCEIYLVYIYKKYKNHIKIKIFVLCIGKMFLPVV